MCCNLYDASHDHPTQVAPQTALAGTLVSSLHRLKDVDNSGRSSSHSPQIIRSSLALDGGFFVFGDLSVKVEGEFRLRFSLFEMRKYVMPLGPRSASSTDSSRAEVFHIKSIVSDPFTGEIDTVRLTSPRETEWVPVFAAKNFPGMSESTFLSRSFGDQGVRLRIRKEPRTLV